MELNEILGEFFRAEIKTSGAKLFSQDKISISSGSDTSIQAYVRATPPFKVHFASDDIASESFTADCSCPDAKKGRFCKHIWATLLAVEEKYPDFLSEKRIIEKQSVASDARSEKQDSFQASAKLRAAQYRKEQYAKLKQRAKESKKASRSGRAERELPVEVKVYPPEIEAALAYFSENGFPMIPEPTESILGEAKRKLSRVFHPDRGGKHDEIIELNKNWELVSRFIRV